MNEKIIFTVCMIITVVIEMMILSQFIEERYRRSYQNKWFYIVIKVVMGMLISVVNVFCLPWVNFGAWAISIGCFVGLLYYHERKKIWMCILEYGTISESCDGIDAVKIYK